MEKGSNSQFVAKPAITVVETARVVAGSVALLVMTTSLSGLAANAPARVLPLLPLAAIAIFVYIWLLLDIWLRRIVLTKTELQFRPGFGRSIRILRKDVTGCYIEPSQRSGVPTTRKLVITGEQGILG